MGLHKQQGKQNLAAIRLYMINRNIKPNDVEISIRKNSKYVGKEITFSQSRSSV